MPALPFVGILKIRAVSKLCPFQAWQSTWRAIPLIPLIAFCITIGCRTKMHENGDWPGAAIIGFVMGVRRGMPAFLSYVFCAMQQRVLLPMHLWSVLGTQTLDKGGCLTSRCKACLWTLKPWCKHFLRALASMPSARLRTTFVSLAMSADGGKQQPDRLPQLPASQLELLRRWSSIFLQQN